MKPVKPSEEQDVSGGFVPPDDCFPPIPMPEPPTLPVVPLPQPYVDPGDAETTPLR
jgi:hypothetical protein